MRAIRRRRSCQPVGGARDVVDRPRSRNHWPPLLASRRCRAVGGIRAWAEDAGHRASSSVTLLLLNRPDTWHRFRSPSHFCLARGWSWPNSRTRLRRGRGVSRGERRSSAEPARFCDTRTALSSLARSMSRHSSCFSGDLESDGPRGGWPWPPQQSKLALPSRSRVVQLANPSPQRCSSSSFRTTAGDYHWTVPAAGENLAQSRSVEGHDDAERRRLRVWRRRLGAVRGPRGEERQLMAA